MPPPQIRLLDVDGKPVTGNTLPHTGPADPSEALPVVLARGVRPKQKYVPLPQIDKTSSDSFTATVIKIVSDNPDRRYIKIINNGPNDIELWTQDTPSPSLVGAEIPHGEVLRARGFGIAESDTCRLSTIYATCAVGVSGLVILEG